MLIYYKCGGGKCQSALLIDMRSVMKYILMSFKVADFIAMPLN